MFISAFRPPVKPLVFSGEPSKKTEQHHPSSSMPKRPDSPKTETIKAQQEEINKQRKEIEDLKKLNKQLFVESLSGR